MVQETDPGETPLSGGNVTAVVRIGDTVRRATGPWSPAVQALLQHLEAAGYDAAPRFLGIDEQGREMLSYVEGHVPEGARPDVVTDAALRDVGRMIRALHVASAGFQLPDGVSWHFRPLSGPEPHVVCHHDLAPRNTVFRDGRAVAFIDWDLATPEAPIHDVIHAAWQFVPFGTDKTCARQGWTEPPDRGRRLRILLDSYGMPIGERVGFAERVGQRMGISAAGIEDLVAQGHPAFVRLLHEGVPARIRADRAWVAEHADLLDAAIQTIIS